MEMSFDDMIAVNASEVHDSIKSGCDTMSNGSAVSFGANVYSLQGAHILDEIANAMQGTWLGDLCQTWSDDISGATKPGMDLIKDCVSDISSFYGIDPIKVFFQEDSLGTHSNGFNTRTGSDNWVGGDPELLKSYAAEYGQDFIRTVLAHEMGHDMFERLGMHEEGYGRMSNEAVADFLSGVYAGSKNLDKEGMMKFLSRDASSISGNYPKGEERASLFAEGYELAHSYPWRDFESILSESNFDLRSVVRNVADRYC